MRCTEKYACALLKNLKIGRISASLAFCRVEVAVEGSESIQDHLNSAMDYLDSEATSGLLNAKWS